MILNKLIPFTVKHIWIGIVFIGEQRIRRSSLNREREVWTTSRVYRLIGRVTSKGCLETNYIRLTSFKNKAFPLFKVIELSSVSLYIFTTFFIYNREKLMLWIYLLGSRVLKNLLACFSVFFKTEGNSSMANTNWITIKDKTAIILKQLSFSFTACPATVGHPATLAK